MGDERQASDTGGARPQPRHRRTERGPTRPILSVNSGSSSVKFGLFDVTSPRTETLLTGEVERSKDGTGLFRGHERKGQEKTVDEHMPAAGDRDVMLRICKFLVDSNRPVPIAVGHRIVHGGPKLRQHCLIDATVIQQLESATIFAPLHMPPALGMIRYAQDLFSDVPQVACFDTAFHADLPDIARVLPIARDLQAEGIQRYGFHGLSCESILHQLSTEVPKRLIIAHLGNGASVTAVESGRSIDTSMGLTPTGGVVMGTRSGDLDPGVLVYLMREKGFDAARIEDLVNHRSGLLGVSGLASDMRTLHDAASSKPTADLAVRMFCYSVRKQIAAMIGALEGIDLIVFTGGIGENDAAVRAAICRGLAWAGVDLKAAQNRSTTDPVRDRQGHCSVQVLPSLEDEQIARHTWLLLNPTGENGMS
ncbi:acetate/propionate family kinase [Lichenihabitans psoromatis]|uniref:acetate/propionate family kinase n=1 Tax=Lichenihabitans psoromatis TaxID=2528642 RepID=UPI001036BC93|nr:acetate/propionate family kinase [Lichenihabitans psoromatis]